MPPSPDPAQPDSRLPFRGGLMARTTTRAQQQRRVAFDSTHERTCPFFWAAHLGTWLSWPLPPLCPAGLTAGQREHRHQPSSHSKACQLGLL